MLSIGLIIVVLLALTFDFINGFHDTANSIATSVSTRVLSPRTAIIMAAVLNFAGAVFSTSVAKTISGDIVKIALPEYVIIATIITAIVWDLITWYYGIPCSSSHALIGGLIGASITYATSFHSIYWQKGVLNKVVFPLITSPVIGFLLGFIFMNILFELLRCFSQRAVNTWFSKLQILSAAFMSFEHGRNDAQKSMGIITLALFSANLIPNNSVPDWVKLACALAMALGTSVGGWRIIKTIGVNMIRLQPINGFAAETSAAIVISTASAIGAPVSTTHVISTAIMGVGASKRLSAVRWALAKNIVWAWVLTIPTTAIIGGFITWIFKLFIK
jgi:PiT family inorganic phosphate transporter